MSRTIILLFLLSLVTVPLSGCGGSSENSVDLTPVEETQEERERRAEEERQEEAQMDRD